METITEINFKEKQLLHVLNTEGIYCIRKVTEKALMIETPDGKWTGDGYVPMWIPKSIIVHIGFNDSRENSQYGIHNVHLPEWFVNKHSKRW